MNAARTSAVRGGTTPVRGAIPLLVACFNRKLAFFPGSRCEGPGLALCDFDPVTGAIDLRANLSSIDNPGFLAFHPGHRCVYAVSEVHDWEEGVATSVRVKGDRLVYLNKQPTLGNCASHCSLDRSGRFLLVTNYRIGPRELLPGMSVATFPIRGDGSLGSAVSAIRLYGSGPNENRQEQAHAHCVLTTPDNRHVLVADLGGDAVHTIAFAEANGGLGTEPLSVCRLPGGSGPRHVTFHPNGNILYILNELAGTLAWARHDVDAGMTLLGEISTRRDGSSAPHDASDLVVALDGRFLYAANRGDDTLGLFSLQDDGTPVAIGHESVHGHCPRNITLDPTGRFLLVANQNSDAIAVFERHDKTGRLLHRHDVPIGTPMCLQFLQARVRTH